MEPGGVGGESPNPFLTHVFQTDPQAITVLQDQVSDVTVEIVTSQINVFASELLKHLVFVEIFLQIFSFNLIFSDFKYFKFIQ